jgi:uncharacterized OsmC-like protein
MTVRYLGAVQFEAESRGHKVVCDQPLANGGFDEGMTPVEFLLAALGTCAGYYAVEYLKTNQLNTEGLELTVNADKIKGPARLDNFQLHIHVPFRGKMPDSQHLTEHTLDPDSCDRGRA